MARDFAPVCQLDNSVRAFGSYANCLLRRQDFYSEALGLYDRAPSQIAAAKPSWKAKVVLDSGAHACLAAGSFPLDHHRMQALGSSINSSSQSGRTPANDRQIVETGLRSRSQPNLLRHVSGYTLEKSSTIWENDDWKIGRLRTERFQQTLCLGIIGRKLDINPLIWNVIACQKIPQLIRSRRPARA